MKHVEVLQDIRDDFIKMGGDAADVAALNAAIAFMTTPKPEGDWVLVPRDATPEMWEAGMNCHSPDDTQGDYLEKAWSAMLAAAPQPPAEAQPVAGAAVEVIEEMRSRMSSRGRVGDGPVYGGELIDWANRLEAALAQDRASQAATPSAPVGVEGMVEAFEEYHRADHRDPAVAPEWEWWQAAWNAALAGQQGGES